VAVVVDMAEAAAGAEADAENTNQHCN